MRLKRVQRNLKESVGQDLSEYQKWVDYDMEKLSKLMEKTSAFDDAPAYRIDFAIKDEKSAEEELLKLAYKDAEMQAKFIASASGKELKDCVKVSFEPFDEKLTSESRLGSNEMMYCAKASARAVSESIQTVEE